MKKIGRWASCVIGWLCQHSVAISSLRQEQCKAKPSVVVAIVILPSVLRHCFVYKIISSPWNSIFSYNGRNTKCVNVIINPLNNHSDIIRNLQVEITDLLLIFVKQVYMMYFILLTPPLFKFYFSFNVSPAHWYAAHWYAKVDEGEELYEKIGQFYVLSSYFFLYLTPVNCWDMPFALITLMEIL